MPPASTDGKPDYVLALEDVYGIASQSAFGSSVFYDPVGNSGETLEKSALAKYQYFTGETWRRFGEENWLGEWCSVYSRTANGKRDIVTELQSITDDNARLSASLLLENTGHEGKAYTAIRSAFDDKRVSELSVYKIGDGHAMSGILLASRRITDESLFLVILMD